ncbi:cryptochrome/photolyase family protein [Gammaproteobacteria bacterium LSUCC0057]|uniref:Cryptochrome/photolyase family protein n=1 Tax=Gammaproteobacteria bacterium LSUCC0057 TaxID=2559237 RepID=A0A4Y8UIS1_9GAMM|nr:cryptochrome/photolyase family protein [Gammaproteobacteria bacterium LSUCC0057]
MAVLRLILADQLSDTLATLRDADRQRDWLVFCEVASEASYVNHHKKKIALLFSAMRHFAQHLRDAGWQVHYSDYADPRNSGSLAGEVARLLAELNCDSVVVTEPGEYRLLAEMQQWQQQLQVPVTLLEDDRFLASGADFAAWAAGRKQLRMEFFYREMRRRYQILLDGDQPVGGAWNFDSDNRKPAPADLAVAAPLRFSADATTKQVLVLVAEQFADHPGQLEPFHFAVTREQALQVLDYFIDHSLVLFGDYQDAMVEGEPWLFHSHISFYLNCGLLLPLECIDAAERAYRNGRAPLNAVEGFIRQILGWREYVRGIYWLQMPDYKAANFFDAQRPLPALYWGGATKMNCLAQCVSETLDNAYAHHIQRLMVLGNFALLAGIAPAEVNDWYLAVYADAYEWVELPNVTGMVLFADGGVVASKPYAAGGAYISRMSNYCKKCHYRVKQRDGEQACPFNYLYWDFLARHRQQLDNNPRLGMIYRSYDKMSADKQQLIATDAASFLQRLEAGEAV